MEEKYYILEASRHEAKESSGLSQLWTNTIASTPTTLISSRDITHNEAVFIDIIRRLYQWYEEYRVHDPDCVYQVVPVLVRYTCEVLTRWYRFPWHEHLNARQLVELMIWLETQHTAAVEIYRKGWCKMEIIASWGTNQEYEAQYGFSSTDAIQQYWGHWVERNLERLAADIERDLIQTQVNHNKFLSNNTPSLREWPQTPQEERAYEKEYNEAVKKHEALSRIMAQFYHAKAHGLRAFVTIAQGIPPTKKDGVRIGHFTVKDWFLEPPVAHFSDHIFRLCIDGIGAGAIRSELLFWNQVLTDIARTRYAHPSEEYLEPFVYQDLEKLIARIQRATKGICSHWSGAQAAIEKRIPLSTYFEEHIKVIRHRSTIMQQFLGLTFPIYAPHKTRKRHTYILGKSGSGKTELLKNLIYQDIEAGNGVFVLDPHGDLVQECMRFRLFQNPVHKNRLVYISPEYMRRGFIPQYNPFDYTPEGKTAFERANALSVRAKELSTSFESFFGAESTPNMKLMLSNCVRLLLEAPDVHLGHLITLLYPGGTGTTPYQDILTGHPDDALREYFAHMFHHRRLDIAKMAIITRFHEATSNQFFKQMLYGATSSFDFRRLLDEGYIIFIHAGQGTLSRDGTQILGGLLTAELAIMALGRAHRPVQERKPVFAYIDECQNFLHDGLDKILAEGRKYGVHLVMANQFLGQFERMPRLRQSLLANTAVKLCGSASAKDQSTLEKELRFSFSQDLHLGRGRFVCGIEGYKGVVIQAPDTLVPPIDTNPYYMPFDALEPIILDQLRQYYVPVNPSTGTPKEPQRNKKTKKKDGAGPATKAPDDEPFVPDIDDL